MSPQAVANHRSTINEYARELVENLTTSPHEFVMHIQGCLCLLFDCTPCSLTTSHSYVSRIMVMIIYGYVPSSGQDPLLLMVETVGRLTVDVEMTTVMILDMLPICTSSCLFLITFSSTKTTANMRTVQYVPAWLPGMGSKRAALRGSRLRQEMSESFLQTVQDSRVSPTITFRLTHPNCPHMCRLINHIGLRWCPKF